MSLSASLGASLANAQSGQNFHQNKGLYKEGDVLVKLNSVASPTSAVSKRASQNFITKVQSQHRVHLVRSYTGLNLHHLRVEPGSGETTQDLINSLSQDPNVKYVEPNYIISKQSVGTVTGQAYSQAQVHAFVGSSYGLTQDPIQAQQAWPLLNSGDAAVPVAVVDTGIDFSHPALENSVWTNTHETPSNNIDDDHNGYVDDVHGWNFVSNNNNPADDEGHGTHVSGITIGVGQTIFDSNPAPAAHVAIMPLKFLDSTGSGLTSDAVSAIYYAANMGAKVMNNSWGGSDYSASLAEAITYAYQKDVVFVAAAGNNGSSNDSIQDWPANYDVPNVIAVAANDDTDVIASFSNFGIQSVPLSSPGVAVLSTYPGGQYVNMSGTSMATPFVTGTAALMRYQNPNMNSYQIKQLLLASVNNIQNLSQYVQTSGRLNVLNAVNASMNTPVDSYMPTYNLSADPTFRALSSDSSGGGSAGCGLVSVMRNGDNLEGPRGTTKKVVVTMALLLLPLALWSVLRRPETGASRRKYERFAMDSSVTFQIGDKKLVGQVKTISMGGSDLNTDELLEKGSVITMSIASPDGKTKIDVQGHIVWSEEHKRYGIAFDQVADSVKAQISSWSEVLPKAS